MSTILHNEVRRGFYLDSVALMRLSRTLAEMPGVVEAALMMGSPANKRIMAEAALLADAGQVAQNGDLIIGIRARSEEAGRRALAEALQRLDAPRAAAGPGEAWRARSLRGALRAMPDANLALISVPGEFAAAEASRALRRGLHVMVFSDNVSLADELSLKEEGRALGRLVMGPDCGTAIINGVPLAFANRVPRGEVGVIGASGTGMQEVTSLIAQAGGGISQAIGVGGRDLHQSVGGITTLMALEVLDHDPATRCIVLVSKPPHPDVALRVMHRVAQSRKPFTICFPGGEAPPLPANARWVETLKATAEEALGGRPIGAGFVPNAAGLRTRSGAVVGLYCGGTLGAEAQVILRAYGRRVTSNAPVPGASTIIGTDPGADRITDLGDDEYTRGRPHPMIDPSVRDGPLRAALADPGAGAIVVDVVIGHGAHGDPAGHIAALVAKRAHGAPPVVASVTGTEADPQVRSRQVATLESAGVAVAPSNAQAVELALALCEP
ncbi:MAG: acyl-CoA synthetase FdrA [Gammaproteobacteria bacterium]|nr:acyl-CoA synthetase FdrA [Gammaproteobacteria bacterium]NIR83216.1 acyl-CoA synthetase FdrA [Gammaproteobacteria bacterium]NIR91024.1 acyl-CoA synthetase FdrA [Gammaproteobacteria bacterium]NIU04381.1 acyl-CoA synthetase FdrA [Gammaproteobacteria bacterium]NIV52604.1 acyl-CoA synthetase FdrA [Gammaproteobacteria bacterium]